MCWNGLINAILRRPVCAHATNVSWTVTVLIESLITIGVYTLLLTRAGGSIYSHTLGRRLPHSCVG